MIVHFLALAAVSMPLIWLGYKAWTGNKIAAAVLVVVILVLWQLGTNR